MRPYRSMGSYKSRTCQQRPQCAFDEGDRGAKWYSFIYGHFSTTRSTTGEACIYINEMTSPPWGRPVLVCSRNPTQTLTLSLVWSRPPPDPKDPSTPFEGTFSRKRHKLRSQQEKLKSLTQRYSDITSHFGKEPCLERWSSGAHRSDFPLEFSTIGSPSLSVSPLHKVASTLFLPDFRQGWAGG